jgi:hypothetical protein
MTLRTAVIIFASLHLLPPLFSRLGVAVGLIAECRSYPIPAVQRRRVVAALIRLSAKLVT